MDSLKKYFIENLQRLIPDAPKRRAPLISTYKKKQIPRNFPPNGTLCRFTYKDDNYHGQIKNAQIEVRDYGYYSSFSAASGAISGTSRNGWRDWELQEIGSDQWLLADSWRKNKK